MTNHPYQEWEGWHHYIMRRSKCLMDQSEETPLTKDKTILALVRITMIDWNILNMLKCIYSFYKVISHLWKMLNNSSENWLIKGKNQAYYTSIWLWILCINVESVFGWD